MKQSIQNSMSDCLGRISIQHSHRHPWISSWLGVLLLAITSFASAATISTIAGNPVPTGLATTVGISANGITVNAAGDVYHTDASNHVIRKIDHTTGISTVIAGTGTSGYTGDGVATSFRVSFPRGVIVDSSGNVYIADTSNHRIRKIDTSGNISTIAGTGTPGATGDSGAATSATVNGPQGIRFDSSGNLYIADTTNHRIRKIDTGGTITTVVGTGTAGLLGDGAAATSARINSPRSIAFDSSGNLYIADTNNHRIRKVDTGGTISTYAGTSSGLSGDGGSAASAQLNTPQGIFIDSSDNLYVADTNNHRIRKVDAGTGNISTVAGTSTGYSGDGGTATSAQLASPFSVTVDSSGNLYIGDTSNTRIRKVDTSGNISTYAGTGFTNFGGDGGVSTNAQLATPQGVAVDSAGNVYMADSGHHRIRKIDTSGNISTYAGTGTAGFTGDGGPATSARLNTPLGIALDSTGNLYVADGNNSRIRKIDTSGNISTYAGNGTGAYGGDGGAATSAQISSPFGVGIDSAGNLYIGDTGNQRIRKVDTGGTITTFAGNGSGGLSGDGGAATSAQINTPMQIAITSTGDVYFIDYGNSRVRKVDTGGTITTYAGTNGGLSGDGGPATSAQLSSPRALNLASDGTLYIADTSNHRIRVVDTSGNISTFAGTSSGFSGDGSDATLAQLSSPQGVAISSSGTVYISDTSNRRIRRVLNAVAPDAPTIGTATAGDAQATVTFTAPASDGGAAITIYTATSTPGNITGTCAGPTACSITVTGLTNGAAYTFTVTATNSAGTGSASSASNSVTPKATQTITFANPGTQNFGTTPTLTATSDSSLTVTFTSSTTGVCTITSGGALTFITTGTCTIDADQAGNSTYAAASTVSRSFTVAAIVPGAPTIGTATPGDTQAAVTFSAPASDGGATISGYTVTSNPGGITGTGSTSPITVTGLTNGVAYTFTVTATNSAGTGSASSASNSITPKANQTITFNNPGTQNFGTTPTLTATSDSSLTVTFTSSTTGVCTITSGGALTFITTGTCTIDADQAGNSTYAAASTVSRSFTVNAVVPDAPTIGTATPGDTQAAVTFSAPVSDGGATITGYTVTSNPGGITGTGTTSPITVTGLTNGVAYTFTVTATNSAGTGSASSASNSITPKANQTITFNNPGTQNFGTTPTLTATSDSSLTVTFTSSTTGVCTITSGGALTFITTGTCTIDADQAGNLSYNAASTVSRSFTVAAIVPGAPTIGTATPGDTQAVVTFSAPASDGGATISGYTVTSNPGGITGTGSTSPITVTGLTNGVAYTFTVTATNSAGTGSASSASNSLTPNPGPAVVSVTVPTNGSYHLGDNLDFTITWDQNIVVTGTPRIALVIGVTTVQATYQSSPTATTSLFRYTVLAGQTDSDGISVGALTLNGGSIQGSSGVDATLTLNSVGSTASVLVNTSVPDVPTAVMATAGNAQVTLSWTAPSAGNAAAVTGYSVTQSTDGMSYNAVSAGSCASAAPSSTSTTCTVTGLSNGTAYTFKVAAINNAGTGSASTASSGVVPITVADAPTSVSGSGGNAQAALSWVAPVNDGGAGIIGYEVTQSTDGMSYNAVSAGSCASAAPTSIATSCIVTGLINGTAYTFKVATINSAGNSLASSASNSITPATVPGAPTSVTALSGSTQTSVTWAPPTTNGGSALTGYSVTQSTDGMSYTAVSSGTCTSATTSTSTTCTVTGLSNGTAYFFKIAAINSVGTGSYSTASNSSTPGLINLAITTQAVDNFMLGTAGGAYTLTVSNSGGATSGTITVVDTLASGISVADPSTDIIAIGWNCMGDQTFPTPSTVITCTRSDVLASAAAGGAGSYPSISLIVDVADNAPGVTDDLSTSSVSLDFMDNNGQPDSQVDNTPVLVHMFIDGFDE